MGLKFVNLEMSRFHPTGGGARHHPSSGVHLMRGEALAWYHAHMLLDAIYMVERDIERGEKHDTLLKEYTKVLDILRPAPNMTEAETANCEKYHCDKKMECFNDFRPRWNERLSFRNQVVNENEWEWVNNSLNSWQLRGQYLDTPAFYRCEANETFDCGPLSWKITIDASTDEIKLIASNFTFFIDLNVPVDKMTNYVLPTAVKPWPHRCDTNPDLKVISGIPLGTHVISMWGLDVPRMVGSISHLFTWKELA
jgi:hypothetical protein